MALGLLAGTLAAILFGVGAVLQARAVRHSAVETGGLTGFVTTAVQNPLVIAVVASYLIGFALHAVAIQLLPLYLAQASIALSLPVTAVTSSLVSERIHLREWAAIGLVVFGLVLITLGAGHAGDVRAGPLFAGLAAGMALVLYLTARAIPAGSGAFALGALGGAGYAASAIAVRGLTWPPTLPVLVAAAAVPVFGLIAFWTYSRGLESGGVAKVTAPLIVGEVGVPAVIGIAFLGDGVRPGLGWAIAVGLVCAMVGSILLSRHSHAPTEQATP